MLETAGMRQKTRYINMLTSWKRGIWGERHVILINVLTLPWSQRLSFNIIFFHFEISDAKRWSKRRVGRKRKPLVATVENLTFMLAQHLTAVKDVIFFWPITKGDLIYNLLTGLGGSVLRYSEINYFVGRGGGHLPCLQAVKIKCPLLHVRAVNHLYKSCDEESLP